MSTHLDVFHDAGNIVARFINYCKAEYFNHAVQIINNDTKETFDYNEFHQELENGSYTLKFIDEEGNVENKKLTLEVSDKSPANTFVLFEYSRLASNFFVNIVDGAKVQEYADKNRLRSPNGYRLNA